MLYSTLLQAELLAPSHNSIVLHPLFAKGAPAFSILLASHLLQNLPSSLTIFCILHLHSFLFCLLCPQPTNICKFPISQTNKQTHTLSGPKHSLLPLPCMSFLLSLLHHETHQKGCLHSWPLGLPLPSIRSPFLLFLPPQGSTERSPSKAKANGLFSPFQISLFSSLPLSDISC